MTTCKGCDAEFRKGTLAFLLTPAGLKGARVCVACAKRGVLVVPVLVAPIVESKASRATAKALLEPVVKTLAAQIAALKTAVPTTSGSTAEAVAAGEFINGKIEMAENMLATLKAVRA